MGIERLRQQLEGAPLLVRAFPFLVFATLTMFQGKLGPGSQYWVYAAKTFLGAGLLFLVWPVIAELKWKLSWSGLGVGILVFALWVGLDPYYPKDLLGFLRTHLGSWVGLGPGESKPPMAPTWVPFEFYGKGSSLAWFFIVCRILGSSLVVPALEEVFYRSLIYRYLIKQDAASVPLSTFDWRAFLLTSVVFGMAHYEWLPGILCGMAYQALVCRKGRLGDAILAHAVTNFLLGLWVVSRNQWMFW